MVTSLQGLDTSQIEDQLREHLILPSWFDHHQEIFLIERSTVQEYLTACE